MRFRIAVVGVSLGLLILFIAKDADATCIELGCEVNPVDDACNILAEGALAEDERVRLEVTCRYICSAPGRPGGVSTEPLSEEDSDRVEILQQGCEWPELLSFVIVPDTCPGRSVVTPETPLRPGKYIVRAGGEANLEITIVPNERESAEGGTDSACPTEYEHTEWRLAQLQKKGAAKAGALRSNGAGGAGETTKRD